MGVKLFYTDPNDHIEKPIPGDTSWSFTDISGWPRRDKLAKLPKPRHKVINANCRPPTANDLLFPCCESVEISTK